jgi:transcriptional regulator NrdR family protein
MTKTPPDSNSRGIRCPHCGCGHFYTTHTEPLPDRRIRRRKQCRHCGRRIVTFEAEFGRKLPADR